MSSIRSKDAEGRRAEFCFVNSHRGKSCLLPLLFLHQTILLYRCHWQPRSLTHVNSPGNISTTTVLGSKTLHHWDQLFTIPPIDITPKDTSFEPREGGSIPAWWTSSGHLVVEPSIDGQKLGFMILDTGQQAQPSLPSIDRDTQLRTLS